MTIRTAVLDNILLGLLGLFLVGCMLVGAHTLFGWIGPVALVVGGAWYGWWEIRREPRRG